MMADINDSQRRSWKLDITQILNDERVVETFFRL